MTYLSLRASTATSTERTDHRAFVVMATLWIAALWLICRPFRGIRHDAILYVGQTFNAMWPGQLSGDWFFLTASQDRYTLFTPLMSHAVAAVGLQTAEIGLLLTFNAFFLWASWRLLGELPALLRWSALVSLAALSHTYGGEGSFAFAEPFLDARSLAEPFGVLALALLLRGRIGWSLLALVATLACHPLVAVPVAAVGWAYLCLTNRRWLWLGLLAPLAPVLGLANLGPFAALLHTFDPAWYHEVRTVDSQCFLLDWELTDWAPIVLDLALVVQAWRLLRGTRIARLALATAIASVVLTIVWGLSADLGHNILLTQLQLWRVYWILHYLALCLVPVIVHRHWLEGDRGRLLVGAIVLACVAVQSNWDTGWVGCLWLAMVFAVVQSRVTLSRRIVRLGMIAMAAMCLLIMGFVYSKTREATVFSGSFAEIPALSILFSLPLVAASVGVAGLVALRSSRGAVSATLGATAVAALLFGVHAWDQRPAWQVYTEQAYASEGRPFEGRIPEGKSVFWENSPLQTWLLLHRPSFFSLNQASGLVFSREASMQYARRTGPYTELMLLRDRCDQLAELQAAGRLKGPLDCRPPVSIMKHYCNLPGGGPDYMIFDWKRPEGLVASWKFEEGPPSGHKTWYLYDCSQLH